MENNISENNKTSDCSALSLSDQESAERKYDADANEAGLHFKKVSGGKPASMRKEEYILRSEAGEASINFARLIKKRMTSLIRPEKTAKIRISLSAADAFLLKLMTITTQCRTVRSKMITITN